jgi:hypothetical protein
MPKTSLDVHLENLNRSSKLSYRAKKYPMGCSNNFYHRTCGVSMVFVAKRPCGSVDLYFSYNFRPIMDFGYASIYFKRCSCLVRQLVSNMLCLLNFEIL